MILLLRAPIRRDAQVDHPMLQGKGNRAATR